MQASPGRDLVVGLFVLSGLAAIAYLTLQIGGIRYGGSGGYDLVATFDEIGSLKPRAPVVIAGVKVGQVESISLDDILRAQVTLKVDKGIELPVDTTAAIRTAGLLGDQFVQLEPGAEDDLLKPGDRVAYTESAISIERLIGKFVNNAGLDE